MKTSVPLYFSSPIAQYAVNLEVAAWSTMVNDCIKAGTHETGGILIGQYGSDRSVALITEVTSRPKDSIFSTVTFQRGAVGLKEILASRWDDGFHYVGEWHFHPGGSPEPSGPDIRAMRSIAANSNYSCREPILIILGGQPPQKVTLSVTVFPSKEPSVRLNPIHLPT
ncbi:hypothetical protein D3C85_1096250 [compost metagenome]